ncbi:MAG: CPBP family intramembrane metalloprotease [Candidatus Eisenbacteria bacterium]|nr:CPBP family intramembrane metalloprotease [Candidatus Eisenbacteria bacterium]
MTPSRKQSVALAALVAVFALLAFLTYALEPLRESLLRTADGSTIPLPLADVSHVQAAAWNAAIVLAFYGLMGLLGIWLSVRVGIPGVFRPKAGVRAWLLWPAGIGLGVGAAAALLDHLFTLRRGIWVGFPHPEFPLSLVASATAGIGEEILFRMVVMGLVAYAWLRIARSRHVPTSELGPARTTGLWIGNVVAALVFGVAHLPTVMVLLGTTSLSGIPPVALIELFAINGVIGIAAGERYARDGLVAAAGVHFWANVFWHVVWPMLGP